jgi:hypothetical protein
MPKESRFLLTCLARLLIISRMAAWINRGVSTNRCTAVLASLLLCCLTTSARAGCGDYPDIAPMAASVDSHRISLATDGKEPIRDKHCPCSGPQCSGRSSIPPSPPTNASRQTEDLGLPCLCLACSTCAAPSPVPTPSRMSIFSSRPGSWRSSSGLHELPEPVPFTYGNHCIHGRPYSDPLRCALEPGGADHPGV